MKSLLTYARIDRGSGPRKYDWGKNGRVVLCLGIVAHLGEILLPHLHHTTSNTTPKRNPIIAERDKICKIFLNYSSRQMPQPLLTGGI